MLDNQEPQNNESNVSDNPTADFADTNGMPVCVTNTIFISGLPTAMPRQHLFQKIKHVFSTCGDIKVSEMNFLSNKTYALSFHFQIYPSTNAPDIWLIPRKEDKFKLSGIALVRFEKEESAMAAVGKYNGKSWKELS